MPGMERRLIHISYYESQSRSFPVAMCPRLGDVLSLSQVRGSLRTKRTWEIPRALSLLGRLKALKSPWRSDPGPWKLGLLDPVVLRVSQVCLSPKSFLLRHVNRTSMPVGAWYGEGRPHLLLPESQPRGSALCWVQNEQEMGSRHENYGRAPLHRALRFPTTLQLPLIWQLSYLCVPMGPALWISLLSLIPALGFMLLLFIVRKLRS